MIAIRSNFIAHDQTIKAIHPPKTQKKELNSRQDYYFLQMKYTHKQQR